MANQSNVLLLVVIFSLATTSVVLAQDLGIGVKVNATQSFEARIMGRIFCTPTGNPIVGVNNNTGIAGVNVTLIATSNNGQITLIGQAVTVPGGFYEIVVVNTTLPQALAIRNATVRVDLPITACPLLPLSRYLQALLTLVGQISSPAVRFAAGTLVLVV